MVVKIKISKIYKLAITIFFLLKAGYSFSQTNTTYKNKSGNKIGYSKQKGNTTNYYNKSGNKTGSAKMKDDAVIYYNRQGNKIGASKKR